MSPQPDIARTVEALLALRGKRRLIAIAGPPGSGKSTLAQALNEALTRKGESTAIVPMDGFHLDNRVLIEMGLLGRKGAPETFDGEGFVHLMRRIAAGERVYYPMFDREKDISIAGAAELAPKVDYVLCEGNYLLCTVPPWDRLSALWSFKIFMDPGRDMIAQRLFQRWRDHGLSEHHARRRRDENDLPNAEFVVANSSAADLRL